MQSITTFDEWLLRATRKNVCPKQTIDWGKFLALELMEVADLNGHGAEEPTLRVVDSIQRWLPPP
ncbi:unnamed protein product [Prunus armeniaca]